ncbi:hypothetical protein MVEN_01492200 [Mycena venus]|uniref:Uncharacterized protein n=1 Tax=Mycena venus TaxID=2733690 RepID=A0A8H7CRA4_9AGAR|nr:hypothetical protein MVEN_01492200 [Mycena venus]
MFSRMRRSRPTKITSDAIAATKIILKAIQASTDAFPPLKSVVSAVIVVLELSQQVKSNKKECEHIAKRSTQLVQDIWRQTKEFGVALPAEVEESVVQIEKLFKEIKKFFKELKKENVWERFARQDRNKRPSRRVWKITGRGNVAFQYQPGIKHTSCTSGICCRFAGRLADERMRARAAPHTDTR